MRGVDCFTPYYAPSTKRQNTASLVDRDEYELLEVDLVDADLGPLLEGVDVVFHLAAQPGVRLSWAEGFRIYSEMNINATQRLLEAARTAPISRFVYASSSSVYGQAASYPTMETDPTRPHSPYGVTKLAAELLCNAYADNFGVPTVSLRYFTVYGPRQRPDMAIHRMINAALRQEPFPLYGDGSAVRDFTYVDDVVDANLRAAEADVDAGTVLNVAGGSSTTVHELLALVGRATGQTVPVEQLAAQSGDVARTGGSIERAAKLLDWRPLVDLEGGVERQVAWHRARAD